jgi:hypothetical protein
MPSQLSKFLSNLKPVNVSDGLTPEKLFTIAFFSEAEKAVGTLHGRRFDGRKIQAELYDQIAYQAEDLSV